MQSKYFPSLHNQMKRNESYWPFERHLYFWMTSGHIQQLFGSMAKDPFIMQFQAAFTRKDLDFRDAICFTPKSFNTPDMNKESISSCAVLSSFWQLTALGPDCTQLSHAQSCRCVSQRPSAQRLLWFNGAFHYYALPPLLNITQPVWGLHWESLEKYYFLSYLKPATLSPVIWFTVFFLYSYDSRVRTQVRGHW